MDFSNRQVPLHYWNKVHLFMLYYAFYILLEFIMLGIFFSILYAKKRLCKTGVIS